MIDSAESEGNLFLSLHKWAHRQDENFTTDAFAHLLRRLISKEPSLAHAVLRKLTGDRFKLAEADCHQLKVILQRREDGNQPDIRINSGDIRIIIEVKVGAQLDWEQIQRYLIELKDSVCTRPCLGVLTRDCVLQKDRMDAVHSYARWQDVHEKLANKAIRDPITEYLTLQFLEFLTERRMTMEKVRSELKDGVTSLENLIVMLEEAVKKSGDNPKPEYWKEGCTGVWFGPRKQCCSNGSYWCGISHRNAGCLVFQVYGQRKSDSKLPDRWEWVAEGKQQEDVLRYKLPLTTGFFQGDAKDQWDKIDEFVSHRLKELRDGGIG